MTGVEYYSMINEEINRLSDKKKGLKDHHEKYLIYKGIQSLVRLRTNFVQFIECDSQKKDICECGNTADGTLYEKPMCERCLYYALK